MPDCMYGVAIGMFVTCSSSSLYRAHALLLLQSFNSPFCFCIVANVAFETTEEDLKVVLEQAGPVLHFRWGSVVVCIRRFS